MPLQEKPLPKEGRLYAPFVSSRYLLCTCLRNGFVLEKYCECFQAGIYCGDLCKCIECKNFEGSEHRPPSASDAALAFVRSIEATRQGSADSTEDRNPLSFLPKVRQNPHVDEANGKHKKGCHCKKSFCLKKVRKLPFTSFHEFILRLLLYCCSIANASKVATSAGMHVNAQIARILRIIVSIPQTCPMGPSETIESSMLDNFQ